MSIKFSARWIAGSSCMHMENGDLRIAVQKTTTRRISVLRIVNKETYAVLSSKLVVNLTHMQGALEKINFFW